MFSTSGKTNGIITAAAKLLSIVYVVNDVSLPPSLPVITAAAPAVGHTRHTMSPSAGNTKLKLGSKCSNSTMHVHAANWNNTSHTCHPVMRMSRGLTLQNVANSIMNSTVGMRISAVACVTGFIGDNALI